MRNVLYFAAMLWGIFLTSPSTQAMEVTKSVQVHASADAVWQKIGGFCTISIWHPIVESCEKKVEGGVLHRILTIAGGSKMKETLSSKGTYTYSYLIEYGPFPVTNYRATIKVEEYNNEINESRITWTSTFEPKGTSRKNARDIIEGVYEAGLIHIKRLVNK